MSELELDFWFQVKDAGLPMPIEEWRAIPGRDFRFDYAWPSHRLLVEIQGATYSRGAHNTGRGLYRDYTKLNLATIFGYKMMMFDCVMIKSGEAIEFIKKFFQAASNEGSETTSGSKWASHEGGIQEWPEPGGAIRRDGKRKNYHRRGSCKKDCESGENN